MRTLLLFVLVIGWTSTAAHDYDDEEGDEDGPEGPWMDPWDLKGMNMTEFHESFGLGYTNYSKVVEASLRVKSGLRKLYEEREKEGEKIPILRQVDNEDDDSPLFFRDMLLMPAQLHQWLNGTDPNLAQALMPEITLLPLVQELRNQLHGQREERKVIEFSTSIYGQILKQNVFYQWPRVIIWTADKDFTSTEKQMILDAIAEMERETCMTYTPMKRILKRRKRGWFKKIVNKVKKTAKKVGNGFKKVAGKIVDTIGDGIDFLKQLQNELIEHTTNFLKKIIPGETWAAIIDTVASILEKKQLFIIRAFETQLELVEVMIDPSKIHPNTLGDLLVSLAEDMVLNVVPWLGILSEPPLPRLHFSKHGKKCSSLVGRNYWQSIQPINAGTDCFKDIKVALPSGSRSVPRSHGRMVHEMLHSLGMVHEHQREDTKTYVTITGSDSQNLLKIKDQQSGILKAVPYDLSSVMQYDAGHGIRANAATGLDLGTAYQRFGMTFYDSKALNLAYCSKKCSTKLSCERGGYTDPKDCSKCRCPDGWTDKLCTAIEIPFNRAKCPGTGKKWLFLEEKCIDVDFTHTELASLECHWVFQSLNKRRIHYWFESMDILETNIGCHDSVEVRHANQLTTRGRRFCGGFNDIAQEFRAPANVAISTDYEIQASLRSYLIKDTSIHQNVAFRMCFRDTQCRVRHDGRVFPQADNITTSTHTIAAGNPGNKEVVAWVGDNTEPCRVNVTVVRNTTAGTLWSAIQVGLGTKKRPDKYYRSFAFNHWGRGGVWERGSKLKDPVQIAKFPFNWTHPDGEVSIVITENYRGYRSKVLCNNNMLLDYAFDLTPQIGVGLYMYPTGSPGLDWQGVCVP